jgi:hypothetical protein
MRTSVIFPIISFFAMVLPMASFGQDATKNGQSASETAAVSMATFMSALNQKGDSGMQLAKYLEDLTHNLQPAAYCENGLVKHYSDVPVVLYTDVISIASVATSALKRDNIQIVIIKISNPAELATAIDSSVFASFPMLKYIYVLSEIDADEQQLASLVVNAQPGWSILYAIIKPS